MDDDRLVGALERAHTLTLEHSMLSDAPETSWQTVVMPALQVPPVPIERLALLRPRNSEKSSASCHWY